MYILGNVLTISLTNYGKTTKSAQSLQFTKDVLRSFFSRVLLYTRLNMSHTTACTVNSTSTGRVLYIRPSVIRFKNNLEFAWRKIDDL